MSNLRQFQDTNFITGLRTIAILLVFLIHCGGAGLRDVHAHLNAFVDMGKYGVQMFFVISGFTIYYQIIERNLSFKKFFLIRLARISMPYFPVLLIICLLNWLQGIHFIYWLDAYAEGKITLLNFLLHITYLSWLRLDTAATILGVEWSLSIEVFFYVLIGLLLTRSAKLQSLKAAIAGLAVWYVIERAFPAMGFEHSVEGIHKHWMPFSYGWMFFLGGVAYHLRVLLANKYPKERLRKMSDIFIIAITCLFALLLILRPKELDEDFFAIATFVSIFLIRDHSRLASILTNRAVLFIGSISYSFYLLHFLVISLNEKYNYLPINNPALAALVMLAITIALSWLWNRLFEQNLYKMAKGAIREL